MKNEAGKANTREILRKLINEHKAAMLEFHLDYLREKPTDIFVEMWAATERCEKCMKNRKNEDKIHALSADVYGPGVATLRPRHPLCGEYIERIRSDLIKVLREFAKRSSGCKWSGKKDRDGGTIVEGD